jgi:hypothetical protein
VKRAYDDADYCRAVQAYKSFYPTVSFEGTWRGNQLLTGRPCLAISQTATHARWEPQFEKDGVPAYCHNFVALDRYYVRGTSPFAPGPRTTRFEYDGGGTDKGGTGTLYVDDTQVAQGRIERTVPFIFSYDDFADVGRDTGEPVTDEYGPGKGSFSGADIVDVPIEALAEAHHDPEAKLQALLVKQ